MFQLARQILIGFLLAVALAPATSAQETSDAVARKIVTRTAPVYPELARKLHMEGTVKLQVTVNPNGTVKSVQAIGGNPVLVQAAEDSIHRYKWVPANRETKEMVELSFHPE